MSGFDTSRNKFLAKPALSPSSFGMSDRSFQNSKQSNFSPKNKSSYYELNERLQFPKNPAYFRSRGPLESDQLTQQSLLEFCRLQNIPFNEMDKLLFKLKSCKDNFQIYRVLFDRLVNNGLPSEVANSVLREHYPEPIKLSNTETHYGWPTRIDTAQ